MQILQRVKSPVRFCFMGLVTLAFLILGNLSCTSPHRPTRRAETNLAPGWPKGNDFFHEASYGRLKVALPEIADAEYVEDDEFCATCHGAYAEKFAHNVHRGQSCESCHGPASRHLEARGKEPGLILNFKTLPPAQKSELCLKCHEENRCAPGARWRSSAHAHAGVACTDCHRSHYNVPPGTPPTTELGETTSVAHSVAHDRPTAHGQSTAHNQPIRLVRAQEPDDLPSHRGLPSLRGTSNNLGAVAPNVCYRCHSDFRQFEEIAGPHQICGPNGFNCTTCHDPHGKIREVSRKDLCLECHGQEAPGMAWHSSTHDLQGVACTDCHNPHPRTNVPRVVNISHTSVRRPKRLLMAVDQPETCYKCHPKIFGMNALPSHHPIKEGKIVCTDCHDAHGQFEGNLKGDSVNMVCYRCHAEKQGPFVYEHPPVTENCAYCHQPHGTVANNLLRQPATFLCLRCHSGHRRSFHSGGTQFDIDGRPTARPPLYTNCTQCHQQIHGTDLPSQNRARVLLR